MDGAKGLIVAKLFYFYLRHSVGCILFHFERDLLFFSMSPNERQ